MSGLDEDLRVLEAVLFDSAKPVPARDLATYVPGSDINKLLRDLAELYSDRGIVLRETGGRWAFRSAPELAHRLAPLTAAPRKLPRAVAETLSIVAYHQPVTRAEIEQIRGVATHRGALDTLLELNWIKPGRRRESLGRPVTWVTTPNFLDHFSLSSLADLPSIEEMKATGLLDTRPISATLFDRLEEETDP